MTARLLVVLGPTGTGKTETAVDLARELDGEIVGCDALQVYRELDAGTAKPDREERGRVLHHLVDCVDPRTDFSMAEYVRLADRAIEEIRSRQRLPVVVGGTGLYLRGLLRGVVAAPPRDPAVRDRLNRMAARGGLPRLRRWLARVDPGSERRIPPADLQRTVRALEMALGGGATWSERLSSSGTWPSGQERFGSLKIGLGLERDLLNARLDARVDRFFDGGLVEEIRSLLAAGVPREANAFKAIGYREVLAALDRGEEPGSVRDEVRRNTRRFARRQRTWFRGEPGVHWIDASQGRAERLRRILDLWYGRAPRVEA